MKTIIEIIKYKEMIISLVRQNLRSKYKGSALGFLWTFLNPLLQLVVYTFVFSAIMRSGIKDFYMFLFVALIPWLFFSSSISGGARSVLDGKELIKKIYFPRQVLPIAYVTGAFVNMLLSFLVVFAALFISSIGIKIETLIYLPIILVVEYLLALGITMLTSALTVFFRDLEYILGIITMAWMYLTPIMYSGEMVPEKYQNLFKLNPMTPIISAYRDILYYQRVPKIDTLFQAMIVGILFLIIGNIVFSLLDKRFAEEL